MKSSNQKFFDSFCVRESFAIGSRNLLGRVFNPDGLINGVESCGSALLNDMNPYGFVSKELSLSKVFLLLCLAIEYYAPIVSCTIAILLYGLTAAIAVFINRLTLDWSLMKNRKKPRVEAIRMGALLQNQEA